MKLSQARFIFVFTFVLAGLSACSAKIEGADDPHRAFIPSAPAPAQAAASAVEGKWHLPCTSLSSRSAMSATLEFKGDSFTSDSQVYADTQCVTQIAQDHKQGTFALSAGDKIDLKSDTGGTQYDIYSIEGGALYFGLQAGDTDAQRPTELNKALAFQLVH